MHWQLTEPWSSKPWLNPQRYWRVSATVWFDADEEQVINQHALHRKLLVHYADGRNEERISYIVTPKDLMSGETKSWRFLAMHQVYVFREELDKSLERFRKQLESLIPEEEEEFEVPSEPIIDEAAWQAHCVLMSKAGSGKTNAIRWRMLRILEMVADGKATMLLQEPKGILIEQVQNLRLMYDMRDRVAIIDPEDTASQVAINIFDRGSGSDRDRNSSLAMAKYVLDTLAMSLTPNHRQILEAVVQLMFVLPEEPWMDTLMDTLRSGAEQHRAHFHKLTRATRAFFERQFDAKGGTASRREELVNRLNAVLGQPTFDRLLYQKETTFDLLKAMNDGSIILINANEGFLGFGEATQLYSKFWTAQIYKLGMARYDMLKKGKKLVPCFVFLDEAQQYISDDVMFAAGLNLLREAQVSSCFAMHYLTQIEKLSVRDAISTNTAIKFSAIPETDYHFQCETPRFKGVVKFPYTDYSKLPQATPEQVEEIRQLSRSKFGYTPKTPQVDAPSPQPTTRKKRRYGE